MKPLLITALSIAFAAAAGAASAHAQLEEASPKVGGRVAASPAQLKLWFDDDLIARQSSVLLVDTSGHVVATAAARTDAKDASLLIVPLVGRLPAGRYQVHWRVTSTDRHVNTGDYGFTVAP